MDSPQALKRTFSQAANYARLKACSTRHFANKPIAGSAAGGKIALLAFEGFQFVEGARPVGAQQARQAAVG